MTPEDLKGKTPDEISDMFHLESFRYYAKDCLHMNDVEFTEAGDFLFKEHAECRKKIKPCAGYSYGYKLGVIPVNVGVVFFVVCTVCGKEKEVADVESW